jgi:glutamate-5-semialdehyde dehydrogenase
VRNAKTSRPGVCNAAETVLVHERSPPLLAGAGGRRCPKWNCAPTTTRGYLAEATPASEEDFEREFLDLILAVKVVDSLDEAIAHVARYGTGHSEAILTEDVANAEAWVQRVDAAAVLVNASTRFIDGGELGLGGEVGISTQKLHARVRWGYAS